MAVGRAGGLDRTLQASVEGLAEQASFGSLVLFVGAGASAGAGLPDWNKLVLPLRQELGVGDDVDVLDVAQFYADTHSRSELLGRIHAQLRPFKTPGHLHKALARIPAPVIFTTNYDRLMEQALEDFQGVPPDVIIDDRHVGLIDEARRTTVVKLHGCLSLPDTIVLARDDYESYADGHRAMIGYAQSLLATRTFLFVGFSLLDPNYRIIDHAMRQAIGPYRRRAYAIHARDKSNLAVQYWKRRGIESILVADLDEIPHIVNDLADRSTGNSALSAVRRLGSPQPPPPIQVGQLEQALQDLKTALLDVFQDPAAADLFPSRSAVDVPVETDQTRSLSTRGVGPGGKGSASGDAASRRWLRERGRALLDLAVAVDRLTPLDDPILWVEIGDMLYTQSDAGGAIQAYQGALRPSPLRGGAPPNRSTRVQGETVLRVRGNLGRALAYEKHYARSEWVLRRCVFRDGLESPDGDIPRTPQGRHSVFARLNIDHLRQRPTDASELVYAITRRAEHLRETRHPRQAFEALCEARYIVEPLLDVQHDPQDPAPQRLFHTESTMMLENRWPVSRVRATWHRGYRSAPGRPFNPLAWAYSYLGKCYRLSCQTALDVGHGDVLKHLQRAEVYLRQASDNDQLLPFPYAHRLTLASDTRLPEPERRRIAKEVRRELEQLVPHNADAADLHTTLSQRFSVLRSLR